MARLRESAKRAFYGTCRGLAAVLPPGIAYVLLLPFSAARGLMPAIAARHLPPSRLPPVAGDRPGFVARWRYQTSFHTRWLPLLWNDRWGQPRWRDRMNAEGAEWLDQAVEQRGVIVLTLHTSGVTVLGSWLVQRGIEVGSAVLGRGQLEKAQRARAQPNGRRWGLYSKSDVFLVGDTRSMMRYLRPGRCLLLPADHLYNNRTVEGTWGGGRLRLSRGPFRMARLSGSVVVPVVVSDDGRWRYRIHVGRPVPQALIDAGDDEAAASHVARELMPILARQPWEAGPPLVRACLLPADLGAS